MKNKKLNKILSICFVLILAGAALVSGTFAMNAGGITSYTDGSTNTAGKDVEVELVQLQRGNDSFEEYSQSQQIVPITEEKLITDVDSGYPVNSNFVDRFVTAKNIGEQPIYVRMLVAMPVEFDPQTGAKPINICFGDWGTPQLIAHNVMCDKTLSNIYSIECSTAVDPENHAPGFAMYGLYMHPEVKNDGDYYTFGGKKIDYNISRGLEIKVMIQAVQAEGFDNAHTAFDSSVLLDNPWVIGSSDLKEGDLKNALRKLPDGTAAVVTKVVFDRPAAYESIIANAEPLQIGKLDDEAVAYQIPNGDGTYTVYVLSDRTMYLPSNCSGLFRDMADLTTLEMKNIDTSNVTDMKDMFSGCKSLETVDTSMWETGNVKSMENMFKDCNSLAVLDVSQWNTSNVRSMSLMFYGCHEVEELDVADWNTSKVTNMSQMFHSCGSLTELETAGWDVSDIHAWSYMFYNCDDLVSVDTAGWVTEETTNMLFMFANCKSLIEIDTTGWDTSNVTNMGEAFYGCKSLQSLDTSKWKTPNLKSLNQTFHSCELLETLDLTGFEIDKVTSMSNMFRNCKNLKTVYVSEKWNGNYAAGINNTYPPFYGCTNLVGGAGTKFDSKHDDGSYARVDGGLDAPGYFTYKAEVSGNTATSNGVDIQ